MCLFIQSQNFGILLKSFRKKFLVKKLQQHIVENFFISNVQKFLLKCKIRQGSLKWLKDLQLPDLRRSASNFKRKHIWKYLSTSCRCKLQYRERASRANKGINFINSVTRRSRLKVFYKNLKNSQEYICTLVSFH